MTTWKSELRARYHKREKNVITNAVVVRSLGSAAFDIGTNLNPINVYVKLE
jgi:hypothetical protein